MVQVIGATSTAVSRIIGQLKKPVGIGGSPTPVRVLAAFRHSFYDLFPRNQGVCLLPMLIPPKALKVNLMTVCCLVEWQSKNLINYGWLNGTCASDHDKVACEKPMFLLQRRIRFLKRYIQTVTFRDISLDYH